MNTYSKLIDRLFHVNLFGGMKLALENCHRLQQALHCPMNALTCVHVAGTNGKGSVTTMIAKGLEAAGYRVGLYTSPHISCFRERIKINGEMISEEAATTLLARLFQVCDQHHIPATFFELTTFLAFLHFMQEHVDIAVLETGLGGRLDATNIVMPTLSVITSISLDHTSVLGETVEAIAEEKAGIIKPKIPVVIGPRMPVSTIQRIAKRQGSPLTVVSCQANTYMEENIAIAKTAMQELKLPIQCIEEGLKAKQPCRLERWGDLPVILDVAHNPDGLTELFRAIAVFYPNRRLRLLFGLSTSKDVDSCLQIISQQSRSFHLVSASNGRGVSVDTLHEDLEKLGISSDNMTRHDDIITGTKIALQNAFQHGEILVICGTFFIMREARQALGIVEPVDSFDMNERAVGTIAT